MTFAEGDRGSLLVPRSVSIITVYDNYAMTEELVTAWGHASVVTTSDETVLFDTGGNGRILLANMRTMGLDPDEVDRVVISHGHADHLGGLTGFLRTNANVVVYTLPSFSDDVRRGINSEGASYEDIVGPTMLDGWLFSTGPLPGPPSEQALVVVTGEGQRHGVRRVAPSHCSGDEARAQFQAAYGDAYIAGGAGRTIPLG